VFYDNINLLNMKNRTHVNVVIALLLITSSLYSCMSNKYPYNGIWKTETQGNGEVIISTYFDLKQNEKGLEGVVIMNNAVEIPIENVVVSDTLVSFTIFWGAAFNFFPKGKDMIVQTIWHGGSPIESLAKRVNEAEIIPPNSIPLPEIKDVPSNGLALTPPMGWNSWNYFGININDSIVREIADAMVSSGMADAGYKYIVIDDGWEGGRDKNGTIYANSNFPDMKALADYVHSLGLKLGIYSSPGPKTCGGYEGSYGHELEDAMTFASWGIDYLKYDWCGAMRIYGYSKENMQRAYQKMGMALLKTGRPIIYSICQYGAENVWEWGKSAGGNLWRTTGDINDSWESISQIGFGQNKLAPFAGPGHWNDPDMLEVGNGDLTSDENKAHFTLWCMLAAPLMAGNDLRNMSDETISILTNPDLIAINQDVLGIQGKRINEKDGIEVWSKPLIDGTIAIALFNRDNRQKQISFDFNELNLNKTPEMVYDVWLKEEISIKNKQIAYSIQSHGVALLKIKI
jgi:alpha-galactosidase